LVKTFKERPGNLGILLTGKKGTGKSLTAKSLCIKSGLPVIIISVPYTGGDFNEFLTKITQPCIIFVDEFEKVYAEKEKQHALLPLMDGTFEGKKIFLLTTNTTGNFTGPLNNRPGRIFYKKEYTNLESDTIREIAENLLINKDWVGELMQVVAAYHCATMDMVISIITECNLHNDNPKLAISYLNIQAENSTYDAKFKWKEAFDGYAEATIRQNPLLSGTVFEYFRFYKEDATATGNKMISEEIGLGFDLTEGKDKIKVLDDGTIVVTTFFEELDEIVNERNEKGQAISTKPHPMEGKEVEIVFTPKVVRAYSHF